VDSYHYGTDLGDDVSFGRMPDGSNWGICQNLTKGASNSCTAATPTPAPTNTPTPQLENPTPTPTTKPSPTPTKKPTPTPTLEPTPTQSEEQVFAQTEEVTPTATPAVLGVSSFDIPSLLPKIFIGAGALLLFGAGGSLLLPKLKQYRYNRQHGKDSDAV
ncbi:MAG: hypothetical protein Q8Q24_02130, partial [bacterium]|nr:hypothetical protein [bacterium]